ncbi:MAG: tRNA (guanosine(46)-N7)-methyltransferase TrmB [Bacteroidales bacterium]|nr:tRNA (guanosine(46)-N7)-methyltransferase TrmB [Bacteroidales bacterium]
MLGKKKLSRFRELESLERVFQPPLEEVFGKDHHLKGKWCRDIFGNDHPLILELGCGKGEYTTGLARNDPHKNFIGLDIKGARIWTGAKAALDKGLTNVAFLRTRIDFINSFFARNEVDEIWITFPDPQEKRRRQKKRLPGAHFLNRYRAFLKDGGRVHLKTDNRQLYEDTLELVRYNNLLLEQNSADVYNESWNNETVSIQTYYEKRFLNEGIKINYIRFRLPAGKEIRELSDDSE